MQEKRKIEFKYPELIKMVFKLNLEYEEIIDLINEGCYPDNSLKIINNEKNNLNLNDQYV